MRREERVTVQGPVKEQQPDGMSHRGGVDPKGMRECRCTELALRASWATSSTHICPQAVHPPPALSLSLSLCLSLSLLIPWSCMAVGIRGPTEHSSSSLPSRPSSSFLVRASLSHPHPGQGLVVLVECAPTHKQHMLWWRYHHFLGTVEKAHNRGSGSC